MHQIEVYPLPSFPRVIQAKELNKTITRYEEEVIHARHRNNYVCLELDISHINSIGQRLLKRSNDINSIGPHNIAGTFRFFQLADKVTFTHNGTTVVWKDRDGSIKSNMVR